VLCLLTGALRCQSSVLELKQPKEVKSFQNELTLLNVGGEKSGKFYVQVIELLQSIQIHYTNSGVDLMYKS
jgi:hypothetical protein